MDGKTLAAAAVAALAVLALAGPAETFYGGRPRAAVVVGLTTIPSRLDRGLTERAIRSLLKSTVRPAAIVVTVPGVSARGEAYDRRRAEALERLAPGVVHVRFGQTPDLGPVLKLLGAIDHARAAHGGHASVVVADDDVEYHPRMLELLTAEDAAGGAVGFAGRTRELGYTQDAAVEVAFLEGYAGARYDLDRLSAVDLRDVYARAMAVTPDSFFVDDIVIGAWLAQMGARPAIARAPRPEGLFAHDAAGTEQLNAQNLSSRNELVFRALRSAGMFPLP